MIYEEIKNKQNGQLTRGRTLKKEVGQKRFTGIFNNCNRIKDGLLLNLKTQQIPFFYNRVMVNDLQNGEKSLRIRVLRDEWEV